MTNIEWTDETLNFVTGCTKISPGCDNCYMFRQYPRLKGMSVNGYGKSPDEITLLPERLDTIKTWRKPKMVFVNSMSDTFHPKVPFKLVREAFEVFRDHPQHTFQVLTKRPKTMVHFANKVLEFPWPDNVWAMTSVENSDYLWRVEALLNVPAEVRGLSVEPLLGGIDLSRQLGLRCTKCWELYSNCGCSFGNEFEPRDDDGDHAYELFLNEVKAKYTRRGIDWVIVGGESGRGSRPPHPDWIRDLRDQCKVAGVAFFFKQWGEYVPAEMYSEHYNPDAVDPEKRLQFDDGQYMHRVGKKAAGALLDGVEYREYPENVNVR